MAFYKNLNILRWLFFIAANLGLRVPKHHFRYFELYCCGQFLLLLLLLYILMIQSANSAQTMLVCPQVHDLISKLYATLASSIKDVHWQGRP